MYGSPRLVHSSTQAYRGYEPLLGRSLRKGQSVEAGMDEPISITHQPPQSGHVKQPHKHATPASPTYSTDGYDEESFEDEKSVNSRHR